MKPISRTRGFGLVEMLGALALATLVAAGVATLTARLLDDLRRQHAAGYQQRFAAAAALYLRANQAALYQQAAGGTVAVGLAALKAAGAGFLPAGFSDTNPYGQTPCLLVRRAGAALSALAASEGGEAIGDAALAYIAAHAGAGGGAIKLDPTAPGPAASGAFGSWRLDAAALAAYTNRSCTGTAAAGGRLASALFADAGAALPTDFLYRGAVPGRPELNQMNAPLRMAGAALVQNGAACGDAARIAIDEQRNIVTCGPEKRWKNSGNDTWRDPVANFGALLALTDEPNGAVRVTLDTGRAFVHGSSGWKALAVDQNGNLEVPNRLTAGSGKVIGHAEVGGDMNVSIDVRAKEVKATEGVYGYHLWADSFFISPVFEFSGTGDPNNGNYAWAGRDCHIPTASNSIIYPVGSQLPDKHGITMICYEQDHKFRYQSGGMTP